jgi:hypothetical protein
MTLVEVIGGLALLATLLVATLLARSRYLHQATVADRRLRAVAAADALLTTWHRDTRSLPREGSGLVPGDQYLAWRTQLLPNADATDLGALVVQLQILDTRPQAASSPLRTSVEFLVEPKPAPTTAPATLVPDNNAKNTGGTKKAKTPTPARPKKGGKK